MIKVSTDRNQRPYSAAIVILREARRMSGSVRSARERISSSAKTNNEPVAPVNPTLPVLIAAKE